MSGDERDYNQLGFSGALAAGVILKVVAAIIIIGTGGAVGELLAHRHTYSNNNYLVAATAIAGLTAASLLAAVAYVLDLLVAVYDEQFLARVLIEDEGASRGRRVVPRSRRGR